MSMKNLLKSVVLASGLIFAANSASAQQKVGHINSRTVMESTTDFKNAQTQIQSLGATKDKELQDMFTLYQAKQKDLNDKARNRSEANKETVDVELNKIATEMREMEGKIQESQQQAEKDMEAKQAELFAPIQTKIMTAINAVAKEKGYAYILDLASGSVVYSAGGDDLTADVQAKLGVTAAAAPKK